ncbi:T9SS type B sorting domain-containing protein [Capnocytophaga stomatis]|uniref:T9SS type B sorting domain-containing protein n=1 Tax=Capnocytophaga stomatis TaxID=1848904 RepID=UPI001BB35801|nr:gliding motility-associated C-terminal domain-containing protein [Capnocytophaga stomatis]
MKNAFKHINMNCLRFVILMVASLIFWEVGAQVTIPPNGVTVTVGDDYGLVDNNYKLGKLTTQVTFSGSGTAEVVVTFPEGITMEANSLTLTPSTAVATNIAQNGSVVTFQITGASGSVTFSLDKLISPQAHQRARSADTSYVLQDKVKITQNGDTKEQSSKVYNYAYPILGLTNVMANNKATMGLNSSDLSVVNTGNGKVQDIYLVVEYPSDITHNEVSMNGASLQQISHTGNEYIFKIAKETYNSGNGLSNGQAALALVHKYNVTSRCVKNTQIKYVVNWGEGDTEDTWYQNSGNEALRTVSSEAGAPNIEITRKDTGKSNSKFDNTDYTKTYFTIKNGHCVAEGGVVGTLRVSYTNYGTNTSLASALYKLGLYLRENLNDASKAYHKPSNVRVGSATLPVTAVPLPNVSGQDKLYKVDFSGLTSDPDGANEGLADLDNDGVFDDLPSGATFVIEYDLIKNGSAAEFESRCVTSNIQGGTSFSDYLVYLYSNYATYQTMCGDKVGGEGANPLDKAVYLENRSFRRYHHVTDGSFTPATLYSGASPIEGRFVFGSSSFFVTNIGSTGRDNAKWRIQYKINLPAGVKATNIKWFNADGYPATEPATNYDSSSVTTGRNLVILAPQNNKRGYVTMDFEAECGSNVTDAITYEINLLDNYGETAVCPIKLVCGSKPVKVVCTTDCDNDGPIMIETSGERAENSLGWTDHTMQTRHTKATLKATNAVMLKRSLHHDDIEITARGKQARGTADNLYYTFTTGEGVSLIPKSIVVKFVSGSISGVTQTLTATEAGVTTNAVGTGAGLKRQTKITWNLTKALNSKALQPEDIFEVVATYQVSKYDDINEIYLASSAERLVGHSSYFYMLDATGKEQYCGSALTPEMYTSLTTPFDGDNGGQQKFSGCTKTNIGGGFLAFMARRTPSSNTKLIGEFRPDRLLKQISFTLPKTLVVSNPMTYYLYATHYDTRTGVASHQTINIPLSDYTKTESGNFVTYTLKNEYNPNTKTYKMPPGLLVNHNAYSALLRVETVGSCDSPEVFEERGRVANNPEYYDYFYHYGITQPDGSNAPVYNTSKEFRVLMENKPGVSLAVLGNTTLKVTNLAQEIKVKLTNKNALSAAPYTWLSIPDVQGVEVIGLQEVDGNTLRTIDKVTTISGESMFYLSEAVLPASGREYIIKVRLTNCTQATLRVLTGWNCSKFPSGYNQTCSSATDPKLTDSEKSVTLVHSGSEIQLKRTQTPNPDPQDQTRAKLNMCADNWYEYEINSGGDGDVIDPKISITKELGVTIAGVEVYYPFDAASPRTLTSRDEGTAVVYDLLPAGQPLLGRESTQTENQRKVRVRVNIKPDCEFRGGSTFGMEVLGKNTCGGALEGTRDNAITAAIEGVAEANYRVINTLTHTGGDANACASGATYEGKHSISAASGATTQDGGRVVIRIPQGFKMVAGTFATKEHSGNFSLTDIVLEAESGVVLPSGSTEYRIKVPQNMANDNWFTYQFTVKQPDGEKATNCESEAKIEYYTIDTVGSVACPGGNDCANITTATSEVKTEVVRAERASLVIKNITATSQVKNNKEELGLTFDIENTSNTTYTGTLKIALFDDVNNNGKADDDEPSLGAITLVGQTFAGSTTVAGLQGMIELPQEQVCRLRMKITSADNNCLCDMSDVLVPAPATITGLVKDVTICQTDSKELEYSAEAPQFASYHWSSTDSQAMDYLSANNIGNPVFTYTGADITQDTTFTYTLTVRRAGGCEAIQTVVVTVTPAPAAPAVSPLTFCVTATGADLTPSIASGHNWYTTAKGGTPITSAQVLSTGTYYVSSTNGSCESLRASVNIVISANQTPKGALSEVPFCDNTGQNVTVVQLKAKILELEPASGAVIKVYSGTQLLNDTDVVMPGTTYRYTRTTDNDCESEGQDITILLGKSTVPTGDNSQKFCGTPTVADLAAIYGGNAKIFEDATTLIALTDATNLTNGTYYVRNVEAGKCPSDVLSVSVTVESNCVDAIDDRNASPINGSVGNPNVLNVLTNDILNGVPNIPVSEVTITVPTPATPINGSPNVPTLEPTTGNVSVPADTPSGTYTIVYQICTNTNICDTANVVIVVDAQPIDAKDDTFAPMAGNTGGKAGNVLSNNGDGTDTLGGNDATTSDVAISVVTQATGINGSTVVPTLDVATGDVTVPANTPSGTYTIVYSICEKLNPTNCDTATATVVVTSATLVANPDDFSGTPISGVNGGNTPSVLTNDTLNGSPLNPTEVDLTWGTNIPAGLTPNADGTISVAPNTPSGTYTLTYTICEKLNPTNCDTTTATVVVDARPIDAKDDSFSPVSGNTGGTAGNVLSNNGNGADTLGGNDAAISDVTMSVVTPAVGIGGSTIVPTLDTTTGDVTVPANTPPGTYTIVYRICEKLNPANCDTATATVVVDARLIDAKDDSFSPVSGNTGGTAGNVLSNNGNGADTLGGNDVVISDVTMSVVTPAVGIGGSTIVPTLDTTTGDVTVPANTPPGTYTIVYRICEKLNPTNCDTATATVVVTSATLVANPDDFSSTPIRGIDGGTTPNVLTNDTFNGSPLNPSDVTLTWGTNVPTGFTPNADGTITIAPNTPAGTYTITYTICEKLNPTNCETAEVTIVVTEEPIDAKDDNFPAVSGNTGGKAGNVLSDNGNGLDVLGTNPATIANVNITQVTPASPINGSTNIPTLDVTTGDINVPADTPAGTYTIVYRICEQLNPTNCDTATATVEVAALPIVANDDDYTSFPIYTAVGGTVTTSVLVNDTIGGAAATLGTVTISNPTTPNTNIYIDVSNGTVVVLPNTPAGTYTLTYTICENANATNCSNEANVTVVVLDVPKANDDSATTEINTPVTVNILDNDENIPTTGRVAVVTDPSRGTVQVNDGGTPDDPSDDTITYTPNPGFVGTDTFVYELCDAAGNCSNATVTIEVVAGGDIVPYNAISTNDDGSNDIFYIKGIEAYPNNTVRIYNRWGVKVFEAHGYNNTTKVFRGLSNGRVTIEAPEKLPQGTYYYIIEYVDKNNQTKKKGSWLYIKN